MKIVHYLPRVCLAEGGVVRAVLDLAALLAAQGQSVRLLTADDTDAPEAWKAGHHPSCPELVRIPAHFMPGGLLRGGALATARHAIAEADVLHLHGMWTNSNLQLASAARSLGVPYIISPHGMLDDWCMGQRGLKKRLYLSLVGRSMLERAAFVHLTARGELDQSGKHFPRGRGVVVPILLDLEPYRRGVGPTLARESIPALRTGRPVLLFLSRVHYKKGPDRLLQAAAMLRDRGVETEVIIAGTGEAEYLSQLRGMASRLGIADRVAFVGHVGGDLKLSLYRASDLLVLPTSQENFGLVFYEALASGVPVVTTYGVDTWAELQGSGGAAITAAEPAALADVVAPLLADPSRRQTMGSHGRDWVHAHMDPAKVTDCYIAHYARARRSAHASRADKPAEVGA